MSETKINRKIIIENSHKFFHSKWSFIVLLSISIFFTSLQALLFGLDKMEINYIKVTDSDSWIGWLVLSLGGLASLFSFIETIFWTRFNGKTAIKISPFSSGFIVANSIITKIWFTAAVFLFSFFLAVARYFIWKKQDNNEDKTNKNFWIILSLGAIVIFLGGILLYYYVIIGNSLVKEDFNKAFFLGCMDVLNSVLIIAGLIVITMKSKIGFLLYLIAGIPQITIYSMNGQIISVVTVIVFKAYDVVAYMAWSKNR